MSWQKSSGLSPGTEGLLSRTVCWLPNKDSDLEATNEERSSGTTVAVSFMMSSEVSLYGRLWSWSAELDG